MSNRLSYHDELWDSLPLRRWSPSAALEPLAREASAGKATVLDLGCGDGVLIPPLALDRSAVTGVDISSVALERARERVELAAIDDAVDLVRSSADDLPFADNVFDLVWCAYTLEHVVDTQRVLSETRRVLKPGGKLVVVTPGHGFLRRLRLALIGWRKYFDPNTEQLRFYTKSSLEEALNAGGFDPVNVSRSGGLLVARADRAAMVDRTAHN